MSSFLGHWKAKMWISTWDVAFSSGSADPRCLAVFLESKFNYVLSWTEVRAASDCIWGTPPIDRSRHLLTDEFLLIFSWAYRRSSMVLPFHCYNNICFLKYFFHTFLLTRLSDNSSLLVVWGEAKIWTQITQNVSPFLDFCSGACPIRIIGKRALLCGGHHL